MPDKSNLDLLNEYIKKKGLRYSKQREVIAKAFFKAQDHIEVEDLFAKIQKEDAKIGIATVYRTLNLLKECGLAVKRDFDTGIIVYEKAQKKHHDHLICIECEKIVEFEEEKIERLQDKVAVDHGFKLTFHKMELYGLCSACQS
ncbi:transcriptional repressor [bacterium]|nr:transcriptional repressor [bacterium]